MAGNIVRPPEKSSHRHSLAIIASIGVAKWLLQWGHTGTLTPPSGGDSVAAMTDHGEGEHTHAHGSEPANSKTLSDCGSKNIGFMPFTVKLRVFERTEQLPAVVVEQSGRTQIELTSPFSGVFSKVYVVQGETIEAGSAMFEVRLTHEELVNS